MDELVLVRHGETQGQSSIRLNGVTDVELAEVGRRQLAKVGQTLGAQAFDRVFTSPLRRCRDGVALVAGPGAVATVVDAFREIDFGRWETWTHAEAADRNPETYARWRSEGLTFRFPGGDQRQGFRDRVTAAARRVLDPCAGRSLCLLHKGVLKVIIGELTELPPASWGELPMDLASIHRLRRRGGGWTLAVSNDVRHLGEDFVEDRSHRPG